MNICYAWYYNTHKWVTYTSFFALSVTSPDYVVAFSLQVVFSSPLSFEAFLAFLVLFVGVKKGFADLLKHIQIYCV